jgi:two-component system NtrC family response regulator
MHKPPNTLIHQRMRLLRGGKTEPEPAGQVEPGFHDLHEMIGTCPAMRRVFHLIRKVAVTDVPVLIRGAAGAGKEMVARAIHQRSLRARGSFVPVECGALPGRLLEAELFGQKKGTFPRRTLRGKVELAHHGTLFLDEVGELPLAIQDRLLNFLREYSLERGGRGKKIRMDLRLMAATSRDLQKLAAAGRFREDLQHRLQGVVIELPALKDRGDDVLVMAHAFLTHYAAQLGKELQGFTQEALRTIKGYDWPGNIRELITHIRRAVVMAEGPCVTSGNLGLTVPELLGEILPEGLDLREAVARYEARLITEALSVSRGDLQQAAQALKTSPFLISHLVRKYGLKQFAFAVLISSSLCLAFVFLHHLGKLI